MRRRELISAIAVALAWSRGANAQRSALPVVGFLGVLSPAEASDLLTAFHRGLNRAGFLDGRNIAIEVRWAESRYDRLPALADELFRRLPAVIVAAGGGASTLASSLSSLSRAIWIRSNPAW